MAIGVMFVSALQSIWFNLNEISRVSCMRLFLAADDAQISQ